MKKIVQLLFCALVFNATYAQSIFKQDFEASTIAPMTMVDGDKKTPAPNVATYVDAWNIRAASGIGANGSTVAVSNSWFSPAGAADDWLITPQLSISETGTALLWEAQAVDPAYPDGYEVRVSTTDNETASFTDVIFMIAAEQSSDDLIQRIVSLEAYVGMDIYIAFRNNSFDKFLLALDNIEVKKIQARDVTVNSLKAVKYNEVNKDIPIVVEITNNGGDLLTSVDLNWSDGTNDYSETITGLSLATGQSMEITSSTSFQATEAKLYPISVWTSNPNGEMDLNQADDLIEAPLFGVSRITTKVVVVEEGTGTWCGWCPRGAVGLNAMAKKFPDSFVGIAVHNGDPMTLANYDGPLGISAFPGSKIDRGDDDIDPSQQVLNVEIPIRRMMVTPVAPTVSALGDEVTRTITVSAEAEILTQLDGQEFRLAAVITEDGVMGTTSGYNQANYYSGNANATLIDEITGINYFDVPDPIPASEAVYDHVARVILGGFDGLEGSIALQTVAGDVFSTEFTYTVPASQDMTNMHVALLVIETATGQILNAAKANVELVVGTNEIVDESISNIYPNPASQIAYVDINLRESSEVSLQVTDMMGKIVSFKNLGTLYGKNQMTYDVSGLPTGMYLFKLTAGELVSTKKIAVTK